ncbi:hypothetical protein [Streptomyces sp. YKOK-I1]
MTQADDPDTAAGIPELIRVEDPWPPDEPGLALQLRVWRTAPGRLAVMFADYAMANDRLAPLMHKVLAEYPGESITFYYDEVTNPVSQGYYATLTLTDDGRLSETVFEGAATWDLHHILGPTLKETSRPDDDRPLWGGP